MSSRVERLVLEHSGCGIELVCVDGEAMMSLRGIGSLKSWSTCGEGRGSTGQASLGEIRVRVPKVGTVWVWTEWRS